MISYGQAAASRGLKVIIAGAGGAAHLPGMLASVTTLPVIGVPVPLKHLDGLDSLLSIVQMPAGIPVATVAVGGARNAGLLAVRILAVNDPGLVRANGRSSRRSCDRLLRPRAKRSGRGCGSCGRDTSPVRPPAPAPSCNDALSSAGGAPSARPAAPQLGLRARRR